jgi:nucleotide-binding universal stress UspA family protein
MGGIEMLKHILVTLDSARYAEYSLSHAESMARTSGAKITLLWLFDTASNKSKSRIVDPLDWHIRKMETESRLRKMADGLTKKDFAVETAILEGADAEQLIQYVQANKVDLVILTKQSENVGDFVSAVMKRTATPIVILPVGNTLPLKPADCYQKILVPMDGSQRAEITLPLASTLAQYCNSQLILAHVVRKPEMPRHAPPSAEETELVDRIVEINRAEAERYLENIAARLPGETETRLLVNDNIVASLHSLIDQENVDLVLLSAHGYSGEPQWTYGSITSHLIAYSTKPVLVVQDLPATTTSTQEMQIPAIARSGGKAN